MVILGERYTDNISGFSGVAVSRTTYLYGCVRVGLEPAMGPDGKMPETVYVDEQRLVPTTAPRGGPGDVPPKRDPK